MHMEKRVCDYLTLFIKGCMIDSFNKVTHVTYRFHTILIFLIPHGWQGPDPNSTGGLC